MTTPETTTSQTLGAQTLGAEKPGAQTPSTPPTGFVLVGVDGSEDSVHALAWAVDHAARHQLDVEVITMWSFPTIGIELPSTGRVLHQHALDVATHAVDLVVDDRTAAGDSVPAIHVEAYLSPPAHRLVLASRRADLLVIGRGRQSVLGSTSRHVVNHATCPVAIVSAPAAINETGESGESGATGQTAERRGGSLSRRFSVEHPRMAQAVETVSQHLSAMGI